MRNSIQEFSLANSIYAGATVTAYTVSAGVKTATKATLYSASTGTATLLNPQQLDNHGKFEQAVYFNVDVILSISGLTIPDHDTGIIRPIPYSISGTFTGTLTGGTTSPTTTINYARIGDVVTLTGDATGLSATSNSTAKTITGMPDAILPSVAQLIPITSKDNGGSFVTAYASIATTGVITVYPSLSSTTWTASGVCGVKISPAQYLMESA